MPLHIKSGQFFYANQILCPTDYAAYQANGKELAITDMCVRCQDTMLQVESSALEPEDDANVEEAQT